MKKALIIVWSLLMAVAMQAQLNGKFSVSSSKQVRFSKGNLVYNCTSKSFSFASTQYAVIGTANSTNIANKSGSIDLFGWGTSGYNDCMPYETSLSVKYGGGNSSIAGTQYDWGVKNFSGYRTLTNDEWSYLLSNRTNAMSLRGPATVNSISGWILLPDNWSCPVGITFKSIEEGAKSFTANVYTSSQFSTMESAGAVFLPAAGWRYSSGGSGVTANVTSYVNQQGYYWTANSGAAVNFMYNYCVSGMDAANYSGCAVRLVYDGSGGGSGTKYYTITTSVSPAGAGTVTGAGTYRSSETATFQATGIGEYLFDYYECSNGTSSRDNPWTIAVYDNLNVTARFYRKMYTVTGESASPAYGCVSPTIQNGYKGETVSFRAEPYNGCEFTEWEDGVKTITHTYTFTGNEDTTHPKLRAYFRSVGSFTLTATSAQPEMGSASGGQWQAGHQACATAYPREGYRLDHWSNGSTENPFCFAIYKDSTVTAYFEEIKPVTITVHGESTEGGTVSGGGRYMQEDSVILTAHVNRGYIWGGWYYQRSDGVWIPLDRDFSDDYKQWSEGDTHYCAFKAIEDANYKAVFDESQHYIITIKQAKHGTVTITPKEDFYLYGDTVKIEAIPDLCYDFDQWIIDNKKLSYLSNPSTYVVTADCVYEPIFVQRNCTLKVRSEGKVRVVEQGGDFQIPGLIYPLEYVGCSREVVTLEAQSDDEHMFLYWEDKSTENPHKIMLKGSMVSYDAIFTTFQNYCGDPVLEDVKYYKGGDVLLIEGTGKIKTYKLEYVSGTGYVVNTPWENCTSTNLIIRGGVTYLPENTFYNQPYIQTADLRNSAITEIGKMAFRSCQNLQQVYLPDSLQIMGHTVFYETAITDIIIPEKVKQIEDGAFSSPSFKRVIFTNPEPAPAKQWFTLAKSVKVYVPDGKKAAYSAYGSLRNVSDLIEWHRVKIETTGLGTCTADTTNYVGTGHTVTLTVQPGEGQKLSSLSVFDAAGNQVPLSDKLQFVMPESHVTVQAEFGNAKPSYTIRFLNYDGSVLQSGKVLENTLPTYTGATPTRPNDANYMYTFSGWSPTIVAATANADYKAQYTAIEKSNLVCGALDCDFTINAKGHSGYNSEWTYDNDWVVYGGTYKSGDAYIQMGGGKDGPDSFGNPSYIYRKTPFDCEVKAVKVTFAEGSFRKPGMICNTWGVVVFDESGSSLYSINGETISGEAQELTIQAEEDQPWLPGYKIVVNWYLLNTSGYNGVVYVSKIEFVVETPPSIEGIEDIPASETDAPRKIIINGAIYILRGEKVYTIQGQEVQ